MSDKSRFPAEPEPPFACRADGRVRCEPMPDGFHPTRSRAMWRASIQAAVVAAVQMCLLLTSCSDPISRAEEHRRSAYDRGGTNRQVCVEARKVKAAYVDAGRRDDGAWLAVEIHCTGVDGPASDLIAKQQSDSAMAGHR